MLNAPGDKDRGMADGADVQSKWDLDPPYPPHYCEVCNATFSICHSLDCKWGGIFTACHNELQDGVADLSVKYFNPSHVRDKPLIFTGCAAKRPKANPDRSKATTVPAETPPLEATEYKGGLLIRDLWHNGTDSVHDMRVVNTDANSHSAKTPEKRSGRIGRFIWRLASNNTDTSLPSLNLSMGLWGWR